MEPRTLRGRQKASASRASEKGRILTKQRMQDSRQEERIRANELLKSFLNSPGEDEQLLSELISEHASPMIRVIIRFKFQSNPSLLRETEDIHNDIVVALLDRLRQIREAPADRPIQSFRDYVAVTSYNRCSEYLRQKFPQRRSAENRVRYLVTHTSGFSLWQNELTWICGMTEWTGRTDLCSPEVLRKAAESKGTKLNRDSLQELFQSMAAPVRLDDLADLLADQIPKTHHEAEPAVETSPEPATFYRSYLEKAWNEILELSQKQRCALLLSLRDEEGDGMLVAFVAVGIAGIGRIAEALQMKIDELARIWNELPLSDLQIADLMGIKRQQVINLRKCARERLGRRLVYSKKR